jgi:hypothetical protein
MQAKRYISFILLCVFCLYITPKEIFHAFVTHTDTEHTTLFADNHLEISAEHHHCDLMKIDQQFASADISVPYYDFQVDSYFAQQNEFIVSHVILASKANACNPLRGPPVLC